MTLITPLPSLIRASSHDAGNARMRRAGRTKWSRGDYNAACDTPNRLIRACYGKDGDNQAEMCFIRFQIAEAMERCGRFHLKSNLNHILAEIDGLVNA